LPALAIAMLLRFPVHLDTPSSAPVSAAGTTSAAGDLVATGTLISAAPTVCAISGFEPRI